MWNIICLQEELQIELVLQSHTFSVIFSLYFHSLHNNYRLQCLLQKDGNMETVDAAGRISAVALNSEFTLNIFDLCVSCFARTVAKVFSMWDGIINIITFFHEGCQWGSLCMLFFMSCADNNFLSFCFSVPSPKLQLRERGGKKREKSSSYHLLLSITLFLSVCRSKGSKIGVLKMYIVEMTGRQCREKAWSIRHVSPQKGEGGESEKGPGCRFNSPTGGI